MFNINFFISFVSKVLIRFVDYGNELTVARPEIWAPIKGLTLFTQPPFGMTCTVANVRLTADAWYDVLVDQNVAVHPIDPTYNANGAYEVVFTDCSLNVPVLEALKKPAIGLSAEPPPFVSSQTGIL